MNPKRSRQQTQGNVGVAAFELFVTRELGWIFRHVHQESDVGIDGYIDVVDDGIVTGASLAVQIKCGKTYIGKKSSGGIRYEGEIRHLKFYNNLRSPVLLIVLDDRGENGLWTLFQLENTMPTRSDSSWWTEISRRNRLEASVKSEWKAIAGPTFDFKDNFRQEWASHELNSLATNLIVGLDKDEVVSCDTSRLFSWQKRLTRSRDMMIKKRATVELWFRGWQDDPRELYEVPEVISYFKSATLQGFPWIYWLEPGNLWVGYKLLYSCSGLAMVSETERGRWINMDVKEVLAWMDMQFGNLNRFPDEHEIPPEINKEVSDNLLRFLETATVPLELQ